jgi:hypothetical protein
MKNLFIFILTLISNFVVSQNFDVRKTTWGMTVKEVLSSESPLEPYKKFDTLYKSQFVINYAIEFKNVILGNFLSNIKYLFSNGKLVEVDYKIFDNNDSSKCLYDKVLKSSFIYNFLVKEKSMSKLYCWSYDNASYKVFSGRIDCDFASKDVIDNVENVGKSIKYVNSAIYVLNNTRTIASLEFSLKDDKIRKIISSVNFTPALEIYNKLKINDF